MHVVMVTDRWNEHGGGRERYLAQLRASLRARGRHVTVLAGEALGERRLQHDVETARRSEPASRVLAVRPAVGATHYQLHSGVYAAAFAAERNAYDSLLRRLLFYPTLRLNRRRRHWLQLEQALLSDRTETKVMAFSARSRDDVQRLYGVAGHRIAVTRPGVDLSVFHSVDRADDSRRPGSVRLLFAGHNFVLKGLRWALEAVAAACRRGVDAQIVVAGRGDHRGFSALARRLNIQARVRFAGELAQPALADLYRQTDLLVHPTFYDPFPRVIIEAMASGVPVVTTAACGSSDVITSGENGFVVADPRDVDAVASAMVAAAEPVRWKALSAAAARTAGAFEFERHADDVDAWLVRQ